MISKSYMDCVLSGVSFWEQRCPGSKDGFDKSTIRNPDTDIVELRRVDYPGLGTVLH